MFKSFLFISLKRSIFFFGLFFISFCTSAQINLAQGLVGYFKFDNNVADSSVLGINGVANSLTSVNGFKNKPNSGYQFNGMSSKVVCGISNRGITNTVSISLWIKATNGTDHKFLIEKYDWQNDKGYYISIKNGYPLIGARNTSGVGYSTFDENSEMNIADGKWHHLLGVVANNTLQFWIDGNLEGETIMSATYPDITTIMNLSIGYYYIGSQVGNSNYYDGDMDEVRIYNRVLTADEIAYLSTENTITGLSKIEPKSDVIIFPNPTNSVLEIRSSFNVYQVEVMTIQGKSIGWIDVENGLADVSFLPSGVYLLKILDSNSQNSVVKRFIKN